MESEELKLSSIDWQHELPEYPMALLLRVLREQFKIQHFRDKENAALLCQLRC